MHTVYSMETCYIFLLVLSFVGFFTLESVSTFFGWNSFCLSNFNGYSYSYVNEKVSPEPTCVFVKYQLWANYPFNVGLSPCAEGIFKQERDDERRDERRFICSLIS